MPTNDPAVDSLNYAGVAGVQSVDFEELLFEEVEVSDLFWLRNDASGDSNPAFRKRNDSSALNTRSRTIFEKIDNRRQVYQKI